MQLYYSRENAQNDQNNLMRTSSHGGCTWSTSRVVSGASLTLQDGMTGVATVSGSDLIVDSENTDNGHVMMNSRATTARLRAIADGSILLRETATMQERLKS